MFFDMSSQWPELIAAATCVLSELQLARGKPSGWVWGITAAIFTGAFFWSSGSSMLALFEGIGVVFGLYGLLKWKSSMQKLERLDKCADFLALSILFVYFFCGRKEDFWVLQAVASASFLFGENLIARKREIGWYMCILGDIIVGYILLETGSYTFFVFQLFSVSIGLFKIYPDTAIRLRYFRATMEFILFRFRRLWLPNLFLSANGVQARPFFISPTILFVDID